MLSNWYKCTFIPFPSDCSLHPPCQRFTLLFRPEIHYQSLPDHNNGLKTIHPYCNHAQQDTTTTVSPLHHTSRWHRGGHGRSCRSGRRAREMRLRRLGHLLWTNTITTRSAACSNPMTTNSAPGWVGPRYLWCPALGLRNQARGYLSTRQQTRDKINPCVDQGAIPV